MYEYIDLNCAKAPFDNQNVRKAVALATNRQEIIDLALFGRGNSLTGGPIGPEGHPFYSDLQTYADTPNIEKARELIDQLSDDVKSSGEVHAVISAIELAEVGSASASELNSLMTKVNENPSDLQLKYDLATSLYGSGDTEAAIDQLVEIVKINREWNNGNAREQLLKIFEALGPTDPIAITGRRKLSSILFS